MDTECQSVVEASAMITSGAPLLIHMFIVICEVVVATFLGVQGIALCLDPQGGSEAQTRWG